MFVFFDGWNSGRVILWVYATHKVTKSQSHRVTKSANPWFYRVLQRKKQVCDFVTLVFRLALYIFHFFYYFFIFFICYFIKIRVTESQNEKYSLKTLINQAFFLWLCSWLCFSVKSQSHKMPLLPLFFLHVNSAGIILSVYADWQEWQNWQNDKSQNPWFYRLLRVNSQCCQSVSVIFGKALYIYFIFYIFF